MWLQACFQTELQAPYATLHAKLHRVGMSDLKLCSIQKGSSLLYVLIHCATPNNFIMGAQSVYQLYPSKSFIPLKWPVLRISVWNDTLIWRPWLFKLQSALRRGMEPIWNAPFVSYFFPYDLCRMNMCRINTFFVMFCSW